MIIIEPCAGLGNKLLGMSSAYAVAQKLNHNNLQATDSETTIELNLAVLKVKHTVKRKADKE